MIHEQLAFGDMPPAKKPQPAPRKESFGLDRRKGPWVGQYAPPQPPEFSAACGRHRSEVDFAYSIPGDGKVDGFDTGAEALQERRTP